MDDFPTGKNYSYYINIETRNKRPSGVAIQADLPFDFRLEPLDTFDKLAIALGFSTPITSDDPVFDDQVYAYSNNPFFYQALCTNLSLRQIILELFQSGVTAIFNENGQLIATTPRVKKHGDGVGDENADTLAEKLRMCLKHLSSLQVDNTDTSYSRAEALDKYLKRFLYVTFILSMTAAFICGSGTFYQLVDLLSFTKLSLIASIPFIVAAFIILRALMADTPYGADAFKNFMKTGIITVILLTFVGLYSANIYWDNAAPVQYLQQITSKHYTTGKHGSHSYYVTVNGWSNSETINVHVNKIHYDSAIPGRNFRLLSHPGFLHIEWISVP